MNSLSAITLNGDHVFNVKVQKTKGIDNVKYNKKEVFSNVPYCILLLQILLS